MQKEKVEVIDFNQEIQKCYKIAETGFYRCLAFYSLMSSAEYRPENFIASMQANYGLISFPMKTPCNEEKFQSDLELFTIWRTSACLREAIEYFYNFLDGALIIKHLIDETNGGTTLFKKPEIREKQKTIANSPFDEKIDELKKLGKFDFPFLKTLNKIRNCISHHQGIPSEPEFQKAKGGIELAIPLGGQFTPYILSDEGLKESNDGLGVSAKNRQKLEVGAKTIGSHLQIKVEQKIIKISFGQQMNFSREDIGSIIFYLRLQSQAIQKAILEKAGAL